MGRVYGMYRTTIKGQEIIIRFGLSIEKKNEALEKRLIETVLRLEEKLLLYKNQCFAITHATEGLIIVNVQEGELLDVKIQQIVPFGNILDK
jgi:hypothetical protein